MNKIEAVVIVVLMILLSFFMIQNRRLRNEVDQSRVVYVKPDTSYSKKPFNPVPEYKFVQVPSLVVFYPQEEVEIDTVYVSKKEIQFISTSGKEFSFNPQFLLQYPENSKLVQMVQHKKTLEFVFINPRGKLYSEEFTPYYPDVNLYNYQNGELTFKRKPFLQRFDFSVEAMVRPLVNMYDVNLTLNYKTRKSYYEIGLNSHYYPTLQPNIGYTPFIKAGITF